MEDTQPSTSRDATPAGPNVVSAAQAETFLVAHVGRDVAEVAMVGRQGEWSRAFTFRRADREYVIRFSALQEDFAKDRLAARFAAPDLPIPRIVELGEAFGGFFAISERAFGGYLDDLDGAQMRAILPSLFAALDAARQIDLAGSTGYGGWGADGKASHPTWRDALLDVANDPPTHRTYGWRARLAASPTGTGPFDEGFAHLQALADHGPDERHLIHSDLLNYNVLVSDNRVSAVIDWGCAMYGDFLYDIAWLQFWSPWYPAWQGIDFGREALRHYESNGLDVPEFDERLRCCQVRIGLDGQAYNAFKGRWPELEATARRTLEVATSGR